MERYRKALVAVVGAVVAILAAAGVDDPQVEDTAQAVVTFLTALLVYVVPNDR
jgi:uncharacterized membrane protein